MTNELSGKVAIVTGSGRNIGRAIALALADDGASIVVNSRSNRDEAEAVAREIETVGQKALVHVGDSRMLPPCRRWSDMAIAEFGRIDILVNNAALRREKPFSEMTYADWREVMDVILDGTFHCVKACLPALAAKRGRDHRQYRRPECAYRCQRPRPCGDGQGGHHRLYPRAGPRPGAGRHYRQLRGARH